MLAPRYKTVIDADKKGISINLKELVKYKDLFLLLAYRDYRVRYAQTLIGFAWAFIQPLATLLIFIVVFGKAIQVDTGNIPYPVFAVAGMIGWSYFSFVLNQAGGSIIGSQEMVKKIYFPRLVIPLSKALVGLVDFTISFIITVVFMIIYGIWPSVNIVFLPLFILIVIISSLAVGIWLSALSIRYRDFKHIIPFLVQFGLYATPVAYPSELVVERLPEWAVILFYLNPMAGVIEGIRWSLFGLGSLTTYSYVSFGMIALLFVSALFYFKKMEKVMADYV